MNDILQISYPARISSRKIQHVPSNAYVIMYKKTLSAVLSLLAINILAFIKDVR